MHSKDEIIEKVKEKIGYLGTSVLAKQSEIKVYVALPFEADSVLYGYDVIFKKVSTDSHGIIWEPVSYERTL
jgi:hypothetical protein